MKKKSLEQGFALLEALIAMFITAGVLLALGVLHVKSVQQSALAAQRTIATIQANDLIDRMWASVCSLDDNTGQIANTRLSNIKSQWEKRWTDNDSENTFIDELSTDQIALHKRMHNWAGNLAIESSAKRRYKITIEWENQKAKWYEVNPANKETFTYYFSIPKCEV